MASEEEEARALFVAGRSAYEGGRFEAALEHFRGSYERSHLVELLFNMGSAADRLRRDEEAIDYYERFLREVPEAENREFVEGRIRTLRTPPEERTPSATTGAARRSAPVEGGGSDDDLAQQWWLWTLIAVVVVGAAVGVGVGVALGDPGTEPAHMGNFADGVTAALVRF